MMFGRLLALGVAALLSACASPTVSTVVSPNANFSAYKTYSWIATPDGVSGLVQPQVVAGVDAKMAAAGFTRVTNGDMNIGAHVSVQQKQSYNTFYTGMGYGWGWGGFGPYGMGMAPPVAMTTVDNYDVGTLTVYMFDGKTRQPLWRGTASGVLQDAPSNTASMLKASLDQMFTGFPPGRAAPK
ncbi:MAG: DUF4136 domain-containing protein [Variovorax sp.]